MTIASSVKRMRSGRSMRPDETSVSLTSPLRPRMTIQPNTRITVLTINGMISRNSPIVSTRGRARARK